MKTLSVTLVLFAGLSLVGCGANDSSQTTYDPAAEYREMQAWDRHLQNETNRINQTYDNLNNSARSMGLPTLDY